MTSPGLPWDASQGILHDFVRLARLRLESARLLALGVLCEPEISKKCVQARTVACEARAASVMIRIGRENYQQKEQHISWSTENADRLGVVIVDGVVDRKALEVLSSEIAREIEEQVLRLRDGLNDYPLFEPLSVFLPGNKRRLDRATIAKQSESYSWQPVREATRTVRGPGFAPVDPAFVPSYSAFEWDEPRFAFEPELAAPYLWHLALKEAMASDLCALTMVEYDGLPSNFYSDLGKQCWDEARHAREFLKHACAILPQVSFSKAPTTPWLVDLNNNLDSVNRLPIPYELNFYAAIWCATLEQRLVLMHHDTESPGVRRLAKLARSKTPPEWERLKEVFENVRYDEVTHAKLGATWLRYLLPKRQDRNFVIDETRLLRGVLLTAAVPGDGEHLGNFIEKFIGRIQSSDKRAPFPQNA
jgi:hypothetical protein